MKTTDTENPNPDRAQLHPEQLDTTTPHLFEITIILDQRSFASIRLEAANADQARAKAAGLELCDILGWEVEQDVLTIESVLPVRKGGSHE